LGHALIASGRREDLDRAQPALEKTEGHRQPLGRRIRTLDVMERIPAVLIEFPADDPERARLLG
jgi:hypothetical protein